MNAITASHGIHDIHGMHGMHDSHGMQNGHGIHGCHGIDGMRGNEGIYAGYGIGGIDAMGDRSIISGINGRTAKEGNDILLTDHNLWNGNLVYLHLQSERR